jgi:DNA-binding MarR family transcriptional regulator
MGTERSRARPEGSLTRTVARDCIAYRLRLINRAVTAIYDEVLRPWALKVSQMNVLVVVSTMDRARPSELARALRMEPSTLSRNLTRMRARGWLEVLPGEDARSQRIGLSAAGRRLLRDAHPAWRRAQRRAARLLGERHVAAIHAMARSVRRQATG